MADVTGVIGNEPVELDNAATEATLKNILAALKGLNQSIVKIQPSGNSAGSSGTGNQQANQSAQNLSNSLQNLNNSGVNPASSALGLLGKTVGAAAKTVGALTGAAAGVMGGFADLAGKMLDGNGSVSDFYKSMSNLPLGIGVVAGLFGKLAAMQEEELATYRKITQAGVNFGGDLTSLRSNALSLGLDLTKFGDLIKSNSATFAQMGGTVNEGSENFVKLAQRLRDDPVGRQLRALGIDSEQASQGLATYLSITGGRNKQELQTIEGQKKLTASAAEYMMQLDALAQITGQSKEEQEKALKAEMEEASFQAFMATKSKEEQDAISKSMLAAGALYGKAGQDIVRASAMGIAVQGEAGKKLTALSNGTATAIQNDLAIRKRGGDQTAALNANEAKGRADAVRNLLPLAGAVGTVGGALKGMDVAVKGTAAAAQAGLTTEKDFLNQRKEVAQTQQDLANSQAKSAAEAEKAFKDVGSAIYEALRPAIKTLTPIVTDLATQFMGFVKDNMPAIKEALTTLVTFVSEFVKNMFSNEGQAKIANDISYFFQQMMLKVREALGETWLGRKMGGLSKEDADAERAKLDANKQSLDAAARIKRSEMDNAKSLAALQVSTNATEKKKMQDQLAADTAALDILKKKKDLTTKEEEEVNRLKEAVKSKSEILDLSKDQKAMSGASATKQGNILDKIINIESGGNAKAQAATSSAFGLGQFTKGTFTDLAKRKDSSVYGKTWEEYKASPEIQRAALQDLTTNNQAYLSKQGVATTGGSTYLAHFLGAGGASKLLRASNDTDIMSVIGQDQYRANRSIFDKAKTVGGLKQWAARKMGEDENAALQASSGGLFTGPGGGYNVTLHGKELVIPMNDQTQVSKAAIAPGGLSMDAATAQSNKMNQMFDSGQSAKGVDLLVTELQTLNKHTQEVLRWAKETAEHTKRTVDATKSLNKNLYA